MSQPVAQPILSGWMKTLVDYVRSGEPDLTNRQMALLLVVYLNPGPHTVRGLARILNVSKPVVTRALPRLGALGYLRRQRDDTDKRNIFVARTSEGAVFLEEFGQFVVGDSHEPTTARGGAEAIRA
ncbi:MarR family winged helix-turn-helix transcriptional regulator [soil metagenome]